MTKIERVSGSVLEIAIRRFALAAFALGISGVSSLGGAHAQAGALGEWRHYGGDLASSKYSPLSQIDAGNVDELEVFWRWQSPDRLIAGYEKKHEEQREKAQKLFYAARGDFQKKKKEDAYAKLEEILKESPCTYHAFYAMDWLKERTDKPKKEKTKPKGKKFR